jgi:hypothetical protein
VVELESTCARARRLKGFWIIHEVMARWWREAREVAASPMLSAEKHGHRVDVAETT